MQVSLGQLLGVGKASRIYSKDRGMGKEPLSAKVKLTGQLAVMSS